MKLTNDQFMDGLKAVSKTLAALKVSMSEGQELTELQTVEMRNRIDLIKRQCDFLGEDL